MEKSNAADAKISIAKAVIFSFKSIFSIPGGVCRFYPCCSTYASEAIRRYSIPKAIFLIAWRLLRCNPFARGGYDPLPGDSGRN